MSLRTMACVVGAMFLGACQCEPDRCAAVVCSAGQTCDPSSGQCAGGAGGGAGGGAATGGGGVGGSGGAAGGGAAGGGAAGGGGGGTVGGGGGAAGGGGGEMDAGEDAGLDAGLADAGTDGGPLDSGIDAGLPDAGLDAGLDAGVDAGPAVDAGLPGDICQTAERIAGTAAITTTSFSVAGYADNYDFNNAVGCFSSVGPDRVFVVKVPSGQRLSAAVAMDAGPMSVTVGLVLAPPSACDALPRVCVGTTAPGSSYPTSWANNRDAGQDVFLIVDTVAPLPPAPIELLTSLFPIPPGDSCANPLPLTVGVPVTGQFTGLGDDSLQMPCSPASGPDAYWSLTVPAGQRLTVTATPSSQLDTTLALMPAGCTSGMCLAGADSPGTGVTDTLQYSNTSGSPMEVLVAVDSQQPLFPGQGYVLVASLSAPQPGDVCGTAVTLSSHAALPNETMAGFLDDYATFAPNCRFSPGPDRVYQVEVPAGQRVVANAVLAPDAGFGIPPGISLVAGTAASCSPVLSCVAGGQGSTGYLNGSGTAQRVFVIVDTQVPVGQDFSLTVDVAAPPPGDSCLNPLPLTPGMSVSASLQGLLDDAHNQGANCPPPQPGPDAVWSLTIPPGERLVVNVSPSAQLDTQVTLVPQVGASDCTLTACLASSNSNGPGLADQLVYTNTSATPLPVFIVVDSAFPGSLGYLIDAELGAAPPGDVCGTAVALPVGSTLTGQTMAGFVNDYSFGTGCALTTDSDRVYSVTVPAASRATVTLTPTAGSTGRLSLLDSASCNQPITCAASGGLPGQGTTLIYDNPGVTPSPVLAIVDGAPPLSFSIDAVIGTTPPGEICQLAPAPITGTTFFSASTAGFVNNYDNAGFSSNCSFRPGPDRVVAFTLAAGQRLTATVIATGWDPALNLVLGPPSNCDLNPHQCLASSDATGSAETVRYSNLGSTARDVFLVIDSFDLVGGGFDLSAIIDTAPPPPLGDTCDNAPAAISTDTTLTSQTLVGYANDYSAQCGPGGGLDRAHAVSIAPGQRLTVTVTTPGWDPALSLVLGGPTACTGTCAAQSDVFGTGSETLQYSNRGATTQTGFVLVDARQLGGQSTYSAGFVFDAVPVIPPGDTCATAPLITAGSLTLQTTSGMTGDYSPLASAPGCTGYTAVGLDRVYAISVAAGSTLTVTLTPTGAASAADDASIYLLPAVAACTPTVTACLSGADATIGGAAETMTWTNQGGSAATVLIVADAYGPELHEFTLTTTLTP